MGLLDGFKDMFDAESLVKSFLPKAMANIHVLDAFIKEYLDKVKLFENEERACLMFLVGEDEKVYVSVVTIDNNSNIPRIIETKNIKDFVSDILSRAKIK